MIEGIKVTISGGELKGLCLAEAQRNRDRAKVYTDQRANFEAAEIEAMQYTNGDPKKALSDRIAAHLRTAEEMEFIAEHVKLAEDYLLDYGDLYGLGIIKAAY